MKRHMPNRSGLTLIELIVAMSILVIIITIVGYIFNEVSKAVDMTDQQMARDVGMQTVVQQLGGDLQNLNRDGFLCLVQGVEANGSGPFLGYTVPPALVFTASGRYLSANSTTAGNAAIVAYAPLRETGSGIAPPANLATGMARYAFILKANAAPPLVDLADLNFSATQDALSASLADVIAAEPVALDANARNQLLSTPARLTATQGLYEHCIRPILRMRTLNIGPQSNLPTLWPYLVGGYKNLKIDLAFTYGPAAGTNGQMVWYRPDGNPVVGAGGPITWVAPSFLLFTDTNINARGAIWTGRGKGNWPIAVRMTVTTCDPDGREVGRPCEMVFDLPR